MIRLGNVKRGEELAPVPAVIHSCNISQAPLDRLYLRVKSPIIDAHEKGSIRFWDKNHPRTPRWCGRSNSIRFETEIHHLLVDNVSRCWTEPLGLHTMGVTFSPLNDNATFLPFLTGTFWVGREELPVIEVAKDIEESVRV